MGQGAARIEPKECKTGEFRSIIKPCARAAQPKPPQTRVITEIIFMAWIMLKRPGILFRRYSPLT